MGEIERTWKTPQAPLNYSGEYNYGCGYIFFEATEPVTWNTKLADAARAHPDDMALHNFFSHTGSDGSNVSIRVDSQAYDWRAVGENLADGQRTSEEIFSRTMPRELTV